MSDKQYKTEWTFSFDKIGESINNLFASLREDAEVKMGSFSEAIEGATSADVNLGFSVGEMTLKSLTASDNLLEADITYIGEIEFTAAGDEHRKLTLKQKSSAETVVKSIKQTIGAMGKRPDLRWDVRLSPEVPMALRINSGVGKLDCDLSQLKLLQFSFNGGTGETNLVLPASAQGYDASFNEGVGATTITLPQNTSINMKVNAGVGSVKIHAPGDTAVRVKVRGGLGDARMPSHYVQVEGRHEFITKSGIWQSPGFEDAAHKIQIDYDGGVGNLTIVSDVTMV